ncbi:hypothetical protein Slala03_75750 [Streptomyces lavendulae subsp. lavendulae]|uniref:hypothetical protein n=1 Tax=Streptomyces TaxID=1883 RepID=UPI0024A38771|nr:hypothetical protein [Streptomyces lavendulae]GLV87886.1 hypothetical protein Slala03_75750 [Streptomyces lavendulae subsp. lavendulae]
MSKIITFTLADGVVPAFTPKVPDELNDAVGTVLGWTAGVGIAIAVLGGLLSWAAIAVGHNSSNAQLAARGKTGVLASLVGAGGIGATSALVLMAYNLFGKK